MIFPAQPLKAYLSTADFDADLSEGVTVGVNIHIDYEGPVNTPWRRFGYRRYFTHQPLFFDPDGEWAQSGAESARLS